MPISGLPWWLGGKEPSRQCWRCRFYPQVGNIPWRRKWQPAPVFFSGKSHGQRTLAGCSPRGCKRVRHNLVTKKQHVGIAGSYGNFIPSFLRHLCTVLHGGCISLHSHQQYRRFHFSLHPAFIVCRFFGDGRSVWCEVIPHCSFDLHFSNNQ